MMKPDFSPEKIGCSNVLDCLYDLKDLDKKIISVLKEEGEMRSSELAEEMDKDQSTVYRSLNKMVSCGLIYKEKKKIRKGGYYYVYSTRPIENVREEAMGCIEDWCERMRDAIEELDEI